MQPHPKPHFNLTSPLAPKSSVKNPIGSKKSKSDSLIIRRLFSTFSDWMLLMVVGLLVVILTPLNSSKFLGTAICFWPLTYFSFFIFKTHSTPGKILFGLFIIDQKPNTLGARLRMIGREVIVKPLAFFSTTLFWCLVFPNNEDGVYFGLTVFTIIILSETVRHFKEDGRDFHDFLWQTRTISTTKVPLAQKLLIKFFKKVGAPKD